MWRFSDGDRRLIDGLWSGAPDSGRLPAPFSPSRILCLLDGGCCGFEGLVECWEAKGEGGRRLDLGESSCRALIGFESIGALADIDHERSKGFVTTENSDATEMSDTESVQSSPRLLQLPAELRECIYDYYLESLEPTTFVLGKDTRRKYWTLVTKPSRCCPVLLIVCKTLHFEFSRILSKRLGPGLSGHIPLSRGPTIKVEPRWRAPGGHDAEGTLLLEEEDEIPGILSTILSESAPSLRLHLVMPQSPNDADLFNAMLHYVIALCNSRTVPLKDVTTIRDPVTGPGWAADIDAVAKEVSKLRCERMAWKNWYRSWYAPDPAQTAEQRQDVPRTEPSQSPEQAWQAVLDACSQANSSPWA